MKTTIYLIMTLLILVVVACGGPSQDEELTSIEVKKEELKELKLQRQDLNMAILSLESELKKIDPDFHANSNAILIKLVEAKKETFQHFIEVRGSIKSKKNITLSAETSGKITHVNVEEGQVIRKGQVLVSIDNEIIRKNISEVTTQLNLATTLFEKQESLWKQNVGTEIQYLQAKNNKESLESKLATLRTQLKTSQLTAPFSGKINNVNARIGEMAMPGTPLVRMVSMDQLSITSDISDRYIGKFAKGDLVNIYVPVLDQHFVSEIAAVGQVINPANRTFTIEVKVPSPHELNPNQVVVLTLMDYAKENAIVIPANIILEDNIGDYVYVTNNEDGALKAKKVHITRDMTYKDETSVKEGINAGDQIINDGFREVSDGIQVIVAQNS